MIGLVSDTHGLFRRQLRAALAGVDLIIHAGDAGGAELLRQPARLELALAHELHLIFESHRHCNGRV